MNDPVPSPAPSPSTAPTGGETPLLAAVAGREPSRVPVWFMRQAGRSLPEYKKVREGISMLDSCARPDLVTEITMQPVRRYDVDAAIFYSDIMVPLRAIGVDLDIVPGTGPVIARPVRSAEDLEQLRDPEPGELDHITAAVELLVAELGPTPLIGFCGAPFTLASYLVEGGPSKDYARTKAMMVGAPDLWHELMARLARISAAFLRTQVQAGARAVQVFDSWAGSLPVRDYRSSVMPHSASVLTAVGERGVPRIHFGVGTSELLPSMVEAGADVIGVDWRLDLDDAWRRVGGGVAVQGNLDPALLTAPWPVLAERVRDVLRAGGRVPTGHVFNLGHGVPPTTDPDVLARVVDLVHEEGLALREPAEPARG
ncbi:uroporphyrinogen decarboxylase [Auraticoccus monumenti]|uniref:uroporphyrinogen decarboxylase n=1 Tax=Auraticoccus monumenti TaxID=675864 RepID=UPI001E475AFB|nr:uroporphyrinogen decarboxylase [Auraticoccus monumenti]